MTRNEFIEDVQEWSQLLGFCYDESCYRCDDVYSEESKDDFFNEQIVDMARDADNWEDLYNQLGGIPTGSGYYIRDDYGNWRDADYDDFDIYKRKILEWGDEYDIWEEEYIEEDSEEEFDKAEDNIDETIEERYSLEELFISCASSLQSIRADEEQACKQEKL